MRRIMFILLDALLISSLYLLYFGCFGTIQKYIIFAGIYAWQIVGYAILFTFLMRDEQWAKALTNNDKKSIWFRRYDKITDFFTAIGLLLNGLYFLFTLILCFKFKKWLCSKEGYVLLDFITIMKKEIDNDKQ